MYDYKLTRARNLTVATLVAIFFIYSGLVYYYRCEMQDAIAQRDQAVREISDRALLIEKAQAADTPSSTEDSIVQIPGVPDPEFSTSGMPLPVIGMIQPYGEKIVIADLRILDKRIVDAELRLRKLEKRRR